MDKDDPVLKLIEALHESVKQVKKAVDHHDYTLTNMIKVLKIGDTPKDGELN